MDGVHLFYLNGVGISRVFGMVHAFYKCKTLQGSNITRISLLNIYLYMGHHQLYNRDWGQPSNRNGNIFWPRGFDRSVFRVFGHKKESKIAIWIIHIVFLPTTAYTLYGMLHIRLLGTVDMPFKPWMVSVMFAMSSLYVLANLIILGVKAWHRLMDAKERLLDYRAKKAALRRIEKN